MLGNEVGAVLIHGVAVILDKLRQSDTVQGRQRLAIRVRGDRIACAGRCLRLNAQYFVGGDRAVACGEDFPGEGESSSQLSARKKMLGLYQGYYSQLRVGFRDWKEVLLKPSFEARASQVSACLLVSRTVRTRASGGARERNDIARLTERYMCLYMGRHDLRRPGVEWR